MKKNKIMSFSQKSVKNIFLNGTFLLIINLYAIPPVDEIKNMSIVQIVQHHDAAWSVLQRRIDIVILIKYLIEQNKHDEILKLLKEALCSDVINNEDKEFIFIVLQQELQDNELLAELLQLDAFFADKIAFIEAQLERQQAGQDIDPFQEIMELD